MTPARADWNSPAGMLSAYPPYTTTGFLASLQMTTDAFGSKLLDEATGNQYLWCGSR